MSTASNAAQDAQLSVQDWQSQISHVTQPSKGCFTAHYPDQKWQAVACKPAPAYPQEPSTGPMPFVIGDGDDVTAQVPFGSISEAIGSFDTASVTSESGQLNGVGPQVNDAYTLQLNTNFLPSNPACAGSPNPSCQGWEQFIMENDGSNGTIFIQYWLIKYDTTCPGGWWQVPLGGHTYCFRNNTMGGPTFGSESITNLPNMRLTGHVDAVSDRVDFTDGMNMYTANGDNSVFAATRWTEAEFGVYGDGGGGRANFNAGASLTARTWVNYGSDKKPICTTHGFTGETNNLHFGPAGPVATLPAPALKFNESSAGAAVANCSAAVAVGDVHETTFAGTAYDFQATGDFEMAQIGSDFEVQTRQISGAPTWPNTAMNQAIGTRLGQDVVTVCSGPRLFVNGRSMRPPDGSTLPLPGGGTVSVSGGAYNMTDKAGNSVRVTPRFASPNYLDVSAGAGQWPTKVRGLLGNPNNDRDLLEASDGTVFQVPLSFDDLYRHFGDSWRVKSETSLLTPCGKATEVGNPTNTFYARDLNQDQQARGHTICGQFGVQPAWLDACVLDVAVLGENAAAGYAGAPNPITNGNNLGKK